MRRKVPQSLLKSPRDQWTIISSEVRRDRQPARKCTLSVAISTGKDLIVHRHGRNTEPYAHNSTAWIKNSRCLRHPRTRLDMNWLPLFFLPLVRMPAFPLAGVNGIVQVLRVCNTIITEIEDDELVKCAFRNINNVIMHGYLEHKLYITG